MGATGPTGPLGSDIEKGTPCIGPTGGAEVTQKLVKLKATDKDVNFVEQRDCCNECYHADFDYEEKYGSCGLLFDDDGNYATVHVSGWCSKFRLRNTNEEYEASGHEANGRNSDVDVGYSR